VPAAYPSGDQASSRRRPLEPCARYVPDGVGDQSNSRPGRSTRFLPLTSHGTVLSGGRDRPSKLVIVQSSVMTPLGLADPDPAAVWIPLPARPR